MKRARRTQIIKAALYECAQIIDAALGVDLGIYNDSRLGDTTKEERDLVESTMRKLSDSLYVGVPCPCAECMPPDAGVHVDVPEGPVAERFAAAPEIGQESAPTPQIEAGGAADSAVAVAAAHEFPRYPFGAFDGLDPDSLGLRELREAARRAGVGVPSADMSRGTPTVAELCQLCGELVGIRSRVHFAKVTDKRPCVGSWR